MDYRNYNSNTRQSSISRNGIPKKAYFIRTFFSVWFFFILLCTFAVFHSAYDNYGQYSFYGSKDSFVYVNGRITDIQHAKDGDELYYTYEYNLADGSQHTDKKQVSTLFERAYQLNDPIKVALNENNSKNSVLILNVATHKNYLYYFIFQFFLGLLLSLLLLGHFLHANMKSILSKRGQRIEATIYRLGYKEDSSRYGTRKYGVIYYEYDVQSKRYQGEFDIDLNDSDTLIVEEEAKNSNDRTYSTIKNYHIGHSIDIVYDPKNPNDNLAVLEFESA